MILVTGATGFLGKRVCRMLAAADKEFTPTPKLLAVGVNSLSAAASIRQTRLPKKPVAPVTNIIISLSDIPIFACISKYSPKAFALLLFA